MIRVTRIHYARSARQLELEFADGLEGALAAEFLRVHSPSAEVRGHGPGQEVLVSGKRNVEILDVRPVGHYAIQLVFDDGHDSGIYTWQYLRELVSENTALWQQYLEKLQKAGQSREPDVQVLQFDP